MTYEVAGAPVKHPPQFDGVGGPLPHWVLKQTFGGIPSYNCTEYTIRRLLRQYPRVPPSPSSSYPLPKNYQVETTAAEGILLDLGFSSTVLGDDAAIPSSCLCSPPDGDGQKGKASSPKDGTQNAPPNCAPPQTECAILFFPLDEEPRNRNADHAMVYDPRYCDWGGKMRASRPIIRFRNPVDYITILEGSPANIKNYEVVLFCHSSFTPFLGPMIPDGKFNQGARTPAPDGSMPDVAKE